MLCWRWLRQDTEARMLSWASRWSTCARSMLHQAQGGPTGHGQPVNALGRLCELLPAACSQRCLLGRFPSLELCTLAPIHESAIRITPRRGAKVRESLGCLLQSVRGQSGAKGGQLRTLLKRHFSSETEDMCARPAQLGNMTGWNVVFARVYASCRNLKALFGLR